MPKPVSVYNTGFLNPKEPIITRVEVVQQWQPLAYYNSTLPITDGPDLKQLIRLLSHTKKPLRLQFWIEDSSLVVDIEQRSDERSTRMTFVGHTEYCGQMFDVVGNYCPFEGGELKLYGFGTYGKK